MVSPRSRLGAPDDSAPGGTRDEPRPAVRRPIADVLVVVPTLDEADNIDRLLRGIRSAAPDVDVLVVDDASPDGTADLADVLAASLGSITVVRRHGDPGLGAAYRDGFRYGLEHGYDAIIEMDADLSHEPTAIPALVAALADGADLAIGTRYIDGGATPGWPLHRRLLSRAGGEYARLALHLPAHDPTSGFRAFRADLLRECELSTVGAQGFAFQLEMLHRATCLGARIVEVPIVFRDRTAGRVEDVGDDRPGGAAHGQRAAAPPLAAGEPAGARSLTTRVRSPEGEPASISRCARSSRACGSPTGGPARGRWPRGGR